MTHDNFRLIRKHLAAMYAEKLAPYLGEYRSAQHLLSNFQAVEDFTRDLKEIVADLGSDKTPFIDDRLNEAKPIDYEKMFEAAMRNLRPSDAL